MIRIENLTKQYLQQDRTTQATPALNHVSVTIPFASTTAIIGLNGSGKSTLISLLAGQYADFSGKVTIQGKTAPNHTEDHPVAYAAEQALFHPLWTVNQLLHFVGQLQGLSESEIQQKCQETIHYFELEPLLQSTFSGLSKGMRQRVNLAQSLISKSSLILWDEPTSGLDWTFTELVTRQILRLKAAGQTLIFSTHDIHLARETADRILYLDAGALRYFGTYPGWAAHLEHAPKPYELPLIPRL